MPLPPYLDLPVFVATTPQGVPAGAHPFASVDGSVPGATWTWDHHRTGEPINLDAMPGRLDLPGLAGVGTTMADTDALASVVAVLCGGEQALPADARAVLRAASWQCDHLRADPDADPDPNQRGAALHRFVSKCLSQAAADARGAAFAALCRGVAVALTRGEPLPGASAGEDELVAATLRESGRLRAEGDLVVVDWRGFPSGWRSSPRVAFEAEPTCRVGLWIDPHPAGGPRYTIGAAGERGPADLGPLLAALARREFEHGPPCLAASPGNDAENWGGRATVFGSPWNYGSRLSIDEIIKTVSDTYT